MTVELWMLVATLGVLFGLTGAQSVANIQLYGVARLTGPRDDIPSPAPGVAGRLNRAVLNLLEALAFFTPVVLIANIVGVSSELTVTGAVLFFISRLLHALVYIAGIPWIRTVAFMGGVVGTGMIVFALATS